MGSLQERLAAYANASANLLTQLKELDELREQVKKAKKLSTATPKPLKQRPANFCRRALRNLGKSARRFPLSSRRRRVEQSCSIAQLSSET